MITRAQVKHIQSFEDNNYRKQHGQFVVEGEKMVAELLTSNLEILAIYALDPWVQKQASLPDHIQIIKVEVHELQRITALKTANQVLALVKIPLFQKSKSTISLLLDGVQDPGNIGSIIRIADWYDIQTVYCSESCADAYSSKVIQASMGSVFRIEVIKCDLEKLIAEHPSIPSYASTLQGEDVHTFAKIKEGFIIIGNESKGIRKNLIQQSQFQITIPARGKAESLNAAVAAGIICDCML